jgi:shikimate dehydrogenase
MRKAFVVGHPIGHSRSPLIHGYWLKQYGLAGSYERLDVAPEDFGRFVEGLGESGFLGGNVTIPHKEAAFSGVERRTGRAERLGAVNTLWFEDGVLWGDNTDVVGFVAHLDQSLGARWEETVGTALVIGAGGAARAVVAGLQSRKVERILIVNRTQEKGPELVRDLVRAKEGSLEALPWSDLARAVGAARLIVNTTSQGMTGQRPLAIDLAAAPDGAIVADIVYVPMRTPLLAAAEARGLRIVDGLGMLLHQAVPGFARWFGVTPLVTPELHDIVAADIEGRR